ncbi:MAG: murein biosynthesis integral membrane protein MurJ [Pseudomonadota bacterium]
MKLAKAMATVAGLTGLSRVAGFIRDILTATILGAGPVADAFFVALKLPNFFRRVTAEGAFSVSFVPIYSAKLEDGRAKDPRANADQFASNAFMMMGGMLSAFVLVAMMVMPFIIYGVAPGFVGDEVRFDLAVELSRITFPYLLLMSLTALLGGVLNALDKFAPFAFAPVLFNLSLIGVLLLSDVFETAGHALSYGILVAGMLQLLWLLVAAFRHNFKLTIAAPKMTGDIKKVFKLMGPGVVGAGVMHINLFADLIIASFLSTGSISYLYYADRLNQLPLGVVGIAVGTALLPMLSKAVAGKKKKEAADLFNRSLEYCFFLALPAAVALGAFAEIIIETLFQRGAFTIDDTAETSAVLMSYAIGLPAYIAIKVFSTVHWAHQDTTTPVKISIIATVFNIALSLILIQYMEVAGIALATGLAGWLQIVMHLKALKKRAWFKFDERFLRALMKIIFASFLMLFVCAGYLQILALMVMDLPIWIKTAGLVLSGGGVYALTSSVIGLIKPADIKKFFKKS